LTGLQREILRKSVGQKVTLEVIRNGKPVKVPVQTKEMPDELRVASRQTPGKPKSATTLGLTVQTLTKDLANQFELTDIEGVVVTEVAADSPAEEAGLQHGDVITEVNRTPVKTAEEFAVAMEKADAKKGVLLYVKRGGGSTFVVLKEK